MGLSSASGLFHSILPQAAIAIRDLARGLFALKDLSEASWLDVLELRSAWRQSIRVGEGSVKGPISGRWVIDNTIRDTPRTDSLERLEENNERARIVPTLCIK